MQRKKKKIGLSLAALFLIVIGLASCSTAAGSKAEKPEKVVLDYAYYSPTSLVLKKKGWAEELFEKQGIQVEWVLSQGSNKALEFLNSGSADFTSSAGAAALMAKANGAPVQSVYIYSKPEWTALVTTKNSPIQTVSDLKGKKVAATIGTDPYIFLLRALNKAGLSPEDVEIINLQHGDGASALSTGQVDAWAGLDPHMARLQLEDGARLFYRNPDANTYGVLNVRPKFAQKYPNVVKTVIQAYEKARKWAVAHPNETAQILAEAAKIKLSVAELELKRNDFSDPIPGKAQRESITKAGLVLQDVGTIEKDVNVKKLVRELLEPTYAKAVINGK